MGRLLDEDVLLAKQAETCGQKSCRECRLIGKEHCDTVAAIYATPTASIQTNADRIRSMDIGELANAIMCPNEMDKDVIGTGYIPCDHSDDCNCHECCKNWLQKEVKE